MQSLKPHSAELEQEVMARGITRVTHFTPSINLLSIFQQGDLLSRNQLAGVVANHPELHLNDFIEINDKLRLDKKPDYINLSIEHPNHLLLARFRQACREWCDSWCVIAVQPRCIFYVDTLFSVGNAASSYAKSCGISGSVSAFRALFEDRIEASNLNSSRSLTRDNLRPCMPTDVQAEVLVKDRLSTADFIALYFETNEHMQRARGALSLFGGITVPQCAVEPSLFKERN
ncbi:MAG: DarT ssDNA thymidine ADP-ribosyltransferase family protein [bacterium]